MKKINLGIIGAEDISSVYLKKLKAYDILNIVACADVNRAAAKAIGEKYNVPKVYGSGEGLVKDPDIDIVLNLTIPAAHTKLCMAALEAGKHIYTEKPLASKFEEGKKIMALATEKGLYVGCAPDAFLGGRLQTCRKIIDQGQIGDIIGATAFVVSHGHEWVHPNPDYFYKEGAGPLLDIGAYYMSALLSLIGPVKRVSAMATRGFFEVEVDTHITANLEFASGAVGTFVASFDVWDSELPRIEIYGTKGTLCIRDIDPLDGPNLFGGKVLLRTSDNYRWTTLPRTMPYSKWVEVPVEHPFNSTSHPKNSRGIGLVDMAYAIRDKRDGRASGQMGYHVLEVMESISSSAKEGIFYEMETTFNRPEPLPVDFPKNERFI